MFLCWAGLAGGEEVVLLASVACLGSYEKDFSGNLSGQSASGVGRSFEQTERGETFLGVLRAERGQCTGLLCTQPTRGCLALPSCVSAPTLTVTSHGRPINLPSGGGSGKRAWIDIMGM